MSKIHGWKRALISIIEEMSEDQYTKMLEYLEEIPKSLKTPSSRSEMAQTIIERYGEEKSISEIDCVMREIPRNDPKVQDLLQPFLEKVQEVNKGKKRIHKTDSEEEDKEEDDADGMKNPQIEKDRKIPSWRQTIQDLKTHGCSNQKVIVGKVVQKSGLRPCQTKRKEKNFFFYMGVTDETDCIRVRVFGKDRFEGIEEGNFYSFRNIVMDDNEVMTVNRLTKMSKTAAFAIPKDLQFEAHVIISNSPVCSIKEVLTSAEKTAVSVEGTVKEMGPNFKVPLKNKRKKKNIHKFRLEDETGSIWINLWGDDTSQLRRISVGDLVRVINLKTSCFNDITSLNSTDSTRITKVKSAGIQTVTMEIIGIIKASKEKTELEAQINNKVETLEVSSSLLVGALGVGLEGDLDQRLLGKIPISVDTEIQGNRILKLTAA